ncbi:MAG TPA: L,D-transpeptidase family protein [Mycobacteriales bacterium]|nr:L,D-transpeptidase family protein [Mycobacteriales bacterium]
MESRKPPFRRALTTFVAAGVFGAGMAMPAHAAAPTLSAASPTPAAVGATVTLTGSGLTATSAVTFAGRDAAWSVVDDATVRATVPTGAVDGDVMLVTPDGSTSLPFDVDEPPGAVTSLASRVGDGAVELRFTVPADAAAVVVRRAEGSAAPTGPDQGVEVARALVDRVVDRGLTNGVTYSYGIWVQDSAGSFGPAVSTMLVPAAPVPATLRIGLSAAMVTHGAAVAVTGVLQRSDGSPVTGAAVTLLTRPRGSTTYAGSAAGTTDGAGVVRLAHRVTRHTDFLLRVTGDPFTPAASSAVAPVAARHGLVSALRPSVVTLGSTAAFAGRVTPAVAGGQVRLEQLSGGVWRAVAVTSVDAVGAFQFARRPTAVGEQVLRAVALRTAGHDGAVGVSLRLVAVARVLRAGNTGADVAAVARRLADLRYDVGSVSPVFGYDLRLAVMAFQKVHGLARTGVVDATTRARLGTPSAPRLRFPTRGLSVEIDLVRQVLYFSRDGAVQRILAVSSGNNELYTVDGVTSRAVTPVGSFRVTRKINGVRVSRLGELFQPAYFVGGYAIHGSPSVPGHPASHGCVRVTKSGMARLFPLLPVGTPVHLYR